MPHIATKINWAKAWKQLAKNDRASQIRFVEIWAQKWISIQNKMDKLKATIREKNREIDSLKGQIYLHKIRYTGMREPRLTMEQVIQNVEEELS